MKLMYRACRRSRVRADRLPLTWAGSCPDAGGMRRARAGEIAAAGPGACGVGVVAAWSTPAVIAAGKSAADSRAGCVVMTGSASGSLPGS